MPAGAAGARMSRDESYAIISAKMSNMGCTGVSETTQLRGSCSPSYLGNSAVVDSDQVTGGRIDLETLIEGQSRLKSLRSCRTTVSKLLVVSRPGCFLRSWLSISPAMTCSLKKASRSSTPVGNPSSLASSTLMRML